MNLTTCINSEELIVGLATPPGAGGIAIVRLSGTGAIAAAAQLFTPKSPTRKLLNLPGYSVIYGHVANIFSGERIDEALLTLFRAPRSYTGEDCVELSCHGGSAVVQAIILQTINAGARLAQPGEFTRRAFLNGRIDLSQAEAVADIIRARTEEARRLALRQLDGSLSKEVAALRHELIGAAAAIEVSIDFSDEVGDLNYPQLEQRLEAALFNIQTLLAESGRGKALRDGLSVALAGRPNVGKSSLMNALLRSDRAIVSPFAGTTRDRIDEQLQIDGIAVTLSDTAGLRDALDPVERIGVDRAKDAVVAADLALFVVDASVGITNEDRDLAATAARAGGVVVLLNKCDLISAESAIQLAATAADELGLSGCAIECVSAAGAPGIGPIEQQISSAACGNGADSAGRAAIVSNVRHIQALNSAAESVALALESARQRMPGDFAAIDVRGALNALGLITGETVTEDIIHRIFEDFCVGK